MNYNTQNAKIASITEKTLIVGIDVGSETHYARAFNWRNYEYSKKPFAFSNDEAGFASFKAWMNDMAEKHGMETIIPGMEPTGHYWLNLGAYLQEQGMKPVHVNPHHVKKSKELDDNNPSKNDRKDPKTIAGLVNEGRFSYPYIPTGIYAEIRNIYFIAETKGTTLLDRNELRGVEDLKIQCAKAHFAAISNDSVVYDVVDSYDKLMQVVME